MSNLLSSVLFNIYKGEVIIRFGLWCHQYADDIQVYLTVPSDHKGAVETLNHCLGWIQYLVMGWMTDNKLKRNPDKIGGSVVGISLPE